MPTTSLRIILPSLVAAAFLASCGKGGDQVADKKPAGPPPVNITVAPVQARELQRSVRIVGSLAGLETATLSNRVTGRISKIYVERGDRVKPGAKLLEVEPERFDLAVKESQAALQQTLARLGVTEIPGDNFDVNQTAPVKKARSEFENAKAKHDRALPLYTQKIMNEFEYLDILSAFRTAESGLENSRDEARALVAQARQNATMVSMRSKDFADAIVYAPDGTTPGNLKIDEYAVSDRKVSTGEYLREGTPAITLVADGMLKLQARVPERYLGEVKEDALITFRVEAFPNETFEGRVHIIDPSVDPANRTFGIEALVDNAKYDHRLRPGSFVPGDVLTRKVPNRIMVPQDAVTTFVGVTKVYKLDATANPPKVKAIDITAGQQQTIKDAAGKETLWVEISKGDLKPDDQVAISGLTKLVDGTIVTIDKQAAPEPTAAAK